MNAGAKLALYGAGLVVAFGAAFGLAGVIVPESFVADWIGSADGASEQTDHEKPAEHGK